MCSNRVHANCSLLDASLNNFTCLRVHTDAAGTVDKSVENNALRKRSNGSGRPVSWDGGRFCHFEDKTWCTNDAISSLAYLQSFNIFRIQCISFVEHELYLSDIRKLSNMFMLYSRRYAPLSILAICCDGDNARWVLWKYMPLAQRLYGAVEKWITHTFPHFTVWPFLCVATFSRVVFGCRRACDNKLLQWP